MSASGAGVLRAGKPRPHARRRLTQCGGRDAFHHPNRLPVALSAGVVRGWDPGLVAVSTLAAQRKVDGRAEMTPSMVVIDNHLARGFQRWVHLPGARRSLRPHAGRQACCSRRRHRLPVAAIVVPDSTHGNRASELMLKHLTGEGVTERLELVLLDWRSPQPLAALGRHHELEVSRVGAATSSRCSVPSGTPGASR